MQTVVSLDANCGMRKQIREYMLPLHNVSDATKEQHASYLRNFAVYFMSKRIHGFEDASKNDIDHFLSAKQERNTKNL